jgi:hypothetical protein
MTEMLKVRNWEQFQHYKDRNPPWIKLHFALLSSEDWVSLDDASRVLAIACMLVASRNNGCVPNNPAYMRRVAYLNTNPDFRPLISCGFLEKPLADASTTQALASTLQADARPEERQSREDSLSETSSDEKPKKGSRKKREYPPDFEAIWREYPTDENMSKADAFDAYAKLDAADKDALAASIGPFLQYCRKHPDYRPKHMVGFIKSRRFDGFQSQQTSPADETAKWPKRLRLARERRVWSAAQWGPQPGAAGCRVPTELLQPGDGDGWGEWQEAA